MQQGNGSFRVGLLNDGSGSIPADHDVGLGGFIERFNGDSRVAKHAAPVPLDCVPPCAPSRAGPLPNVAHEIRG